jgi:hypothetical protein
MKKIDLSDVTFLIPIRIDSPSRLRNISLVISYLLGHFNTNVTIVECDKKQQFFPNPRKGLQYTFKKDMLDYFHVTKARNFLTKESHTPIVALWDADFIIPVEAIVNSVSKIRNNEYDVSYPYDGRMYDTFDIQLQIFQLKFDTNIFYKYLEHMPLMYGNSSVGGGLLIRKEQYLMAGMENEKIKMWGADDSERYQRFKGLNLKIFRHNGPAFHLNHERIVVCKSEHQFNLSLRNSKKQLLISSNLEKEDLQEYINGTFKF